MIRVESRLHHQTATIPEPNFYRGVASSWLGCCSRYLHLNKLLRLRLAQPFSPGKETLPAQPALAAKRSYSLPASGLLGDEPLPFLPCLFATLFFGHPTRLLSRAHVSKMGFGYRSLFFVFALIAMSQFTCAQTWSQSVACNTDSSSATFTNTITLDKNTIEGSQTANLTFNTTWFSCPYTPSTQPPCDNNNYLALQIMYSGSSPYLYMDATQTDGFG